ncbi:MAG: HAD family hydrolase [Chloroflexota bacterium]|nr:HAD family hydrolase [Chloroflexota bacterium]MDE2885891.1 HAD family hydrolase [Chloroflexota bacterium]
MIRAAFFDFYGTLADWPSAEDLQQAAAAAEGIAIERSAVGSAYQTANAYLDEENAKGPVRQRTQEERDAVFAEYERRLLAGAGAADVSPDVAFRVWERVRSAPEELTLLPDATAALAELRALDLTLGVISNMGLELDALLDRLGIGEYLQVRATSGSAGVTKPHPRIFRLALAQAGVQPGEAVHIGDSIAADVEGARGAGITPVFVQRAPGPSAPAGVKVVGSLTEAAAYVRSLLGSGGPM